MSSALLAVKDILVQNGLAPNNPGYRPEQKQNKKENTGERTESSDSMSETTIYKNALEEVRYIEREVDPEIAFRVKEGSSPSNDKQNKCNSSSSEEERIDTSDELMEVDFNEKFIADCEAEATRRKRSFDQPPEDKRINQAEEMIREHENRKIRMLGTPGNYGWDSNNRFFGGNATAVQHSTVVDENYMLVGGHVDQALRDKICRGEYIDFARLIPRERNFSEEPRLELVNRGGQTFFVPAERDSSGGIHNFVGIITWQQSLELTNKRVILHCDNVVVVHMINNLTSKCRNCMKLIQLLVLSGLKYNRKLTARYIKSKSNDLADALSRNQMSRFRKIQPKMEPEQEEIPAELWPVQKIWIC